LPCFTGDGAAGCGLACEHELSEPATATASAVAVAAAAFRKGIADPYRSLSFGMTHHQQKLIVLCILSR
jgi:hypothetical protein